MRDSLRPGGVAGNGTDERAAAPLMTVEGIYLSFSGVVALDEVSLSVPSGALFAVIGPNGAGKTSLFNCMSGVYRPERGSIRFQGTELTTERTHRIASLGLARTFQNIALFGQLSVLENMLVGRHHHFRSPWWSDGWRLPRSRREEVSHRARVEEVIEFLDLESVRNVPAQILPYGVLKRVELGRALSMDPALLLLDEPAAGLNQEETEEMARYILDIKEELGVTQLLIEHDLRFVLDLADRVAVLDFGRKIAEGDPRSIRQNPAVVEAYLGVGAGDGEGRR